MLKPDLINRISAEYRRLPSYPPIHQISLYLAARPRWSECGCTRNARSSDGNSARSSAVIARPGRRARPSTSAVNKKSRRARRPCAPRGSRWSHAPSVNGAWPRDYGGRTSGARTSRATTRARPIDGRRDPDARDATSLGRARIGRALHMDIGSVRAHPSQAHATGGVQEETPDRAAGREMIRMTRKPGHVTRFRERRKFFVVVCVIISIC